jgi:ferrochelatase
MKRGVLLVNLGSPDSPDVQDVRRYLREFLMDGRVLDVAYPVRFAIVHFAILPRRPGRSAEAYEKIWTDNGSPLVVTSRKVGRQLRDRLELPVEAAMRYGNPSIETVIRNLASESVTDLFVIPMFPHYAMSSYETAAERVRSVTARLAPEISLGMMDPYFDHPAYVEALVASAAPYLSAEFDHLLFSFHGIPERHLTTKNPKGCLLMRDCCAQSDPAHTKCYRAQCFKTVERFVNLSAVPNGKYSVAFQSRLGREPWLKPHTDAVIPALARRGVRKLLVICPSFVADCLETLEEVALRGRDSFQAAGGPELSLIPCLNEHPLWLSALEQFVKEWISKTTRFPEVTPVPKATRVDKPNVRA